MQTFLLLLVKEGINSSSAFKNILVTAESQSLAESTALENESFTWHEPKRITHDGQNNILEILPDGPVITVKNVLQVNDSDLSTLRKYVNDDWINI